jgi:cold shock CspA family protein
MDIQVEGGRTELALERTDDIQSRLQDLRTKHDRKHLRITLDKNDHGEAEDSYDIVDVMEIPGHTVTARTQRNSVEAASRDAFAEIKNKLQKVREKRASGKVRMTTSDRGIVSKVFYDQGFGFIVMEDRTEVYFNRNAVEGIPFDTLRDGMEVCLNVEPGRDGPQATTVNYLPSNIWSIVVPGR